MNSINRRSFIKTSVLGGVAATFINPVEVLTRHSPGLFDPGSSAASITTGDNRADMTYRALQPFAKQIREAIGNRRVVLKPNNVAIDIQLASTHVDTFEGILEFLKSIKKIDNVIIAESAANGPTFDGFENFRYTSLVNKYPVKLVDLDQEKHEIIYVFDEKDFRPHPVRVSSIMLSPDSFIVSAAKLKTHDRSVVTLSLKNIVFGSPVKDPGFTFGRDRKPGTRSDKSIVHGSGYRGINYNLYALAPRLHPHLSVIDGFEGMEGNGPSMGTPVDHRVCVVSTDWLAADRIGTELMGVDFATVGYLNFCAQTGMGSADLDKINVIGEKITDHIKKYKLHEHIERELIWMKPAD
jgi:uncharacterized protein (DUF362 family)